MHRRRSAALPSLRRSSALAAALCRAAASTLPFGAATASAAPSEDSSALPVTDSFRPSADTDFHDQTRDGSERTIRNDLSGGLDGMVEFTQATSVDPTGNADDGSPSLTAGRVALLMATPARAGTWRRATQPLRTRWSSTTSVWGCPPRRGQGPGVHGHQPRHVGVTSAEMNQDRAETRSDRWFADAIGRIHPADKPEICLQGTSPEDDSCLPMAGTTAVVSAAIAAAVLLAAGSGLMLLARRRRSAH